MTKRTTNLTNRQKDDWAVHLPALSGFYIHQMAKLDDDPNYYAPLHDRLDPAKFEHGWAGLDFYNGTEENSYFQYKWGLYSAGHAKLDLTKSADQERMVQGRREGTFLLGDSGGFQIAKGAGHFKNINWDDFKTPAGDKIRQQVLDWLEGTSDFSMTLDIPAFAAEPPLSLRTGLTSFQDTLDLSILNLHYFMKHRTPGKTKFLNVLSGTNSDNSKEWYEGVKYFSDPATVTEMGYEEEKTLEGYAFAGINMKHMPSALGRMNDLIRDGLLKDKEWIHFLGIGRLDWACYLTLIQRQIRKHYEEKVTISFDCASAFLAVAKGQMYTHPSFSPKRFGYNMRKAIDDRNLKNSPLDMPFGGPVADRMKLGDMCRLGPGEPNKLGKVAKTSWDNGSYMLGMANNVFIHIQAIQEALRLLDYEMAQKSLDYRDWSPKKRTASDEISFFLPSNILFFASFVEEFFDPQKTHAEREQMIADNLNFLNSISFGGQKANHFGSLFDLNDVKDDNEEDAIDEISSYENFDDMDELEDGED